MTNQERRARITALKEQLAPLNQEKIIASLRYNFLANPYHRGELTAEEKTQVDQLVRQLEELNQQISPLYSELRKIQIKYLVEYDGEVLQSGIPTTVFNKKVFYLATDAELDSYKDRPDLSNPDVQAVLSEIRDYIYFQEYSDFTIQHIKKL